MNRISAFAFACALALGLLTACSSVAAPSASSNNISSGVQESATASSSTPQVTPLPNASSAAVASSTAASSISASSNTASSGAASSGFASSAASSEPVLGGPSGLVEMGVAMQYISEKDLLAAVNANDSNKVIIDLRKPEDASAGHIQGAIFAPMNKAVDNNNYADAIANLTGALYDATGNEVGEGKELVLVCYAGKKYAQAATDILNALSADMDKVYTLEGGMTGWNSAGNPVVQ